MKKILRLFPVALALVALASCSDDNLTAQNGEDSQFKLDPNYLYVTVENDNPLTRGAFVSANVQAKAQANGNDFFRTLYWVKGDEIKLYSEKQNWRPQIWGYDETLTDALPSQYKKEKGFSVFKKAITVAEGDAQYTDGYGVMPADLSEFTNENRTELKFDLRGLRYVKYSQEKLAKAETASETATDAADLYYGFGALNVYKSTAPLPLWGVATTGQMKCKWLTGHFCVDLTNYDDNIVPANADATKNYYLVIQSNSKSLWGRFEAVGFDPDDIGKAPELEAEPTTATTITSGVTKIEELLQDCIVLNLGQCADGLKRIIAYAPIMCDDVTPTVVTAKLYTGAASTDFDDADAKDVVLTEVADWGIYGLETETVEAGKLYRIANEDARTIETANTPFSLQQQLTTIDAEMERDYVVTIKNDVLVKTANTKYENMATSVADQHNYVLDLSGIDFKHNVTIKFDGTHGFTNNEVTPAADVNYLFIKTKAGNKKVTIDFGDKSTIKGVVVDNTLAGELILKGDKLGDATNPIEVINFGTATSNGKLTVADAATKISTAGAMNIDCVGKAVKDLFVLKNATGAYTVSLNNGTVEKLTASAAATSVSAAALGAVTSNVNIASTGISAIKDVVKDGFEEWDTTNHRDKFGFYFSSVWDSADSKFADEASASLSEGKIYTAAQLASINGITGNYTVMGNIDLSAAKWSTIATASKNFEGVNINKDIYASNAADGQIAAAYPSIEGLSNPLFGTLTLAANGYVKNIKFEDVAITSNSDRQATVARSLVFSGSVAVENVDVDGATITGTDVTKAKNYGGLFGLVQATAADSKLFVMNVDIKDVTFTANKYIGGIIGQVENTNTPQVIFGCNAVPVDGAAYENVKENTVSGLTINCIKTPNYAADPEYKASGAYIGYFKNNTAANLIAVGATLNYDFTANAIYTNEGRWGTTLPSGAYITFDVVMGQKLFGYADNVTTRKATFVTKSSANKFSNVVKASYNKQADGQAAQTAGTLLYYVDDNRE